MIKKIFVTIILLLICSKLNIGAGEFLEDLSVDNYNKLCKTYFPGKTESDLERYNTGQYTIGEFNYHQEMSLPFLSKLKDISFDAESQALLDYTIEKQYYLSHFFAVLESDLDKKKELLDYLDNYCRINGKNNNLWYSYSNPQKRYNLLKQSISEIIFMKEHNLPLYSLEQDELQKEIAFYKISPDLYKKIYTNYYASKLSVKAFEKMAKDTNLEVLYNTAAENKIDAVLLNSILLDDGITFSKKESLLNSLNKYHKHLKQRCEVFEYSYFTGGTIIVPVFLLSGLCVSEIIYLPKSLIAKYNLSKLGINMRIDTKDPLGGNLKRWWVVIERNK